MWWLLAILFGPALVVALAEWVRTGQTTKKKGVKRK